MPITRSAKKKLRQDVKRQKHNILTKNAVKDAIKKFRKNKSEKLLHEAYSMVDKAVKRNIFHVNKAARLKSAMSKYLTSKKQSAPLKKPKKKK